MSNESPQTLTWIGDARSGLLRMIDQTLLPCELTEIDCADSQTLWEAIKMLRVRGAPAIGIAAGYGVVIGLQEHVTEDAASFYSQVEPVVAYLASSRPTAVNLFWALERMQKKATELQATGQTPVDALDALLVEAVAIHDEDRQMCHDIGRHGAELLAEGDGVITHCNAGGLATAEYGTALSILFTAHDQGKKIHVFADETRPLLQGARLTAWELMQHGVPVTLICDNMAAQVMREGRAQAVITGADRVTARGDAANKIGTYGLAVLAKAHNIPFYIAAPTSTFDMTLHDGGDIPIEQRADEEITCGFGRRTGPEGVNVYNPAFDVTPAELITGIITERGIISPVTEENVSAMLG